MILVNNSKIQNIEHQKQVEIAAERTFERGDVHVGHPDALQQKRLFAT